MLGKISPYFINSVETKKSDNYIEQIENFKKLLYLTDDIFFQTDLEGRFKWINQALKDFLRQSEEQISGKEIFAFIHPEDKSSVRELMQSILPYEKSSALELRFLRPDGDYCFFECRLSLDPQRESYYFAASDISERKIYQEELLRLESIIEASLDGIYAIDCEGRIQSWNKAAEKIFGFSKDEIIGQTIHLLAFPDQREEMDNLINIIRRGETYSYETIRQKKDGETVAVFITLAPIRDSSGEVLGSSAVARDITSHRRLEKEIAQLDKLNTIVELASVISHEVRNPMTTVKGFLQLLYHKIKDKVFREYFEIMIEEMDRVNSILQEFNTIGKKHKESTRMRHNLKTIIKSMAPLLEADAVSQGKTIKFLLRETPDLMVDGNEIRQLILNLTRNALEAMEPNGSVLIKTFVENGQVILAVQDFGKGIAESDLEKLGTPFFTTKESGTGLGLYVCYEIAQRHEAQIKVNTGPKGTTFSVIFPQHAILP
ncbi:MAG TPA: PAS domain S-box protein [Peptococcaceae bacterium]|nr:PAS domain S-box protein [Peptococcaceae bacterium]